MWWSSHNYSRVSPLNTYANPVSTHTHDGLAPASPSLIGPAVGEVLSFGMWMQREGYRPLTIWATVNTLKAIAKHADILEPERAKEYLTRLEVTESRKQKMDYHAPTYLMNSLNDLKEVAYLLYKAMRLLAEDKT